MFTPKFYPYLFDYSKRFNWFMGSAGSAKSYFITQKLIIKAMKSRRKILMCRKYGTTLKNSCFALVKEILAKWQLTEFCKINSSNYNIIFPNGSEIIMMRLDDESKLLSLSRITEIFIEEASEISKDLFEQLNLRLRGNVPDKQIYLAWNPISKNNWLYEYTQNLGDDSFYIHSTFRDNPFLDEAYIEQMNKLYKTNPAKALIFCDGEWRSDPEGCVFHNWRVEPIDPLQFPKLEHRAGSDLGWVDATTVINTLWDEKNNKIYVFDEFYKSGCQLDEVAQAIRNMKIKCKIYFDSAEPRTIDYMKKQGFYAAPCLKGPNSVYARIAFLQNCEIIIDPKCKNLITEFQNFSYVKDKNTGKYKEGEYTHEWSHGIDGLGYAYSDIYTKSKLKTIDKSLLGL